MNASRNRKIVYALLCVGLLTAAQLLLAGRLRDTAHPDQGHDP